LGLLTFHFTGTKRIATSLIASVQAALFI
jgi:hypothetical protein